MALHREVYKLGLRDDISKGVTRNVDYHSHENEQIINTKPLSYITGLIREFQHINSTSTVGYDNGDKVNIQQNLLLPACLKVLFFTNKCLNSFKSQIHLNNI
jgi:hypothetical protein